METEKIEKIVFEKGIKYVCPKCLEKELLLDNPKRIILECESCQQRMDRSDYLKYVFTGYKLNNVDKEGVINLFNRVFAQLFNFVQEKGK